ncbi:MAG: replication-relaxation family protein [Planctomycetaceae bacterium]
MLLQERDVHVLSNLARYFILNSRQIRELSFPDDATGRITRRRMNKMMHAGYVRKRSLQVVNPADGSTTPVYHLTRNGREFLAGHMDDETLLRKPVEPSQPQHLYHYVAVSETHRLFDAALATHPAGVSISKWVNEDEFINPEEPDSSQRRMLRTKSSEASKVVCLPDAGFVVRYNEQNAVVYLEQDRDTFFHERTASRKSPGYRQLLAAQGHRAHFPESTLPFFYVLVVTPTAKRANQLRHAFAKKNRDQDVQKTFRFGSLEELNASNLLFEPMYSCCHHDDKVPLIRRIE